MHPFTILKNELFENRKLFFVLIPSSFKIYSASQMIGTNIAEIKSYGS